MPALEKMELWRGQGSEPGQKKRQRDVTGGPVVRAAHFHCRGYGFDPWSRSQNLASCRAHPSQKGKGERKSTQEMQECAVALIRTYSHSQTPV